MYTRKLGEQQAANILDWIVNFPAINQWNMLTESELAIIFALIQKNSMIQATGQIEFCCLVFDRSLIVNVLQWYR
jgi:hypothetical protein